jgi:hypothetical protein
MQIFIGRRLISSGLHLSEWGVQWMRKDKQ